MLVRRWVVVRVKRSLSAVAGLLLLVLLMLLGHHGLQDNSLARLYQGRRQVRAMLQYWMC